MGLRLALNAQRQSVPEGARASALLHAIRGHRSAAMGMLKDLIADIEASQARFRIEVYLCLYLFMGVRRAALLEAHDDVRALGSRLSRSGEGRRDWLFPEHLASVSAHVAAADGRLEEACSIWGHLAHAQWGAALSDDRRLRLAAWADCAGTLGLGGTLEAAEPWTDGGSPTVGGASASTVVPAAPLSSRERWKFYRKLQPATAIK